MNQKTKQNAHPRSPFASWLVSVVIVSFVSGLSSHAVKRIAVLWRTSTLLRLELVVELYVNDGKYLK